MGHEKATIILSGSLVELALTYFCESKGLLVLSILDHEEKKRNKKLYDCVLSDLIAFIEDSRTFGADFSHLTNLSRIYRNFVHPGRELKDSLDNPKAELCFISTLEILKKILP